MWEESGAPDKTYNREESMQILDRQHKVRIESRSLGVGGSSLTRCTTVPAFSVFDAGLQLLVN